MVFLADFFKAELRRELILSIYILFQPCFFNFSVELQNVLVTQLINKHQKAAKLPVEARFQDNVVAHALCTTTTLTIT